MPNRPSHAAIQAAQLKSKRLGLRQSDIAKAIGASQPQVSRVFAGESHVRSKLADKICRYVETVQTGVGPEAVCKNKTLVDALAATWNGTESHAVALAAVIRALGALNVCDTDLQQARPKGAK